MPSNPFFWGGLGALNINIYIGQEPLVFLCFVGNRCYVFYID